MKTKQVRAIQDELDQFLNKIAEDGTTAESLTTPPKKNQDNLGIEQQEAAEAAGSTVHEDVDGTDVNEEDDHGIPKRDIDNKAEGNADMKVKHESITMEQKAAQMERLGRGVVGLLDKMARESAAPVRKLRSTKVAAETRRLPEGITQKSLEKMANTANKYAAEYFDRFMAGMVKRAQDEKALSELKLDPRLLRDFGGVSGLLDKMAQEMPEAVLPPEVLEEAGMTAPVEAPVEAPMAGEPSPEELEAISAAMDQMGVTPEILEQAMGLIEELKGQGYSEEDIAQAAAEMMEEMAPAVEEAPVEEEVEEVEEVEPSVAEELNDKVAEYLARRNK